MADIDSAEEGDVVAFDGLNGDDYVYTNIFDMLKWDKALREGTLFPTLNKPFAGAGDRR